MYETSTTPLSTATPKKAMNPTPFVTRTAADGSYRINDVPAGHYELRTWQQ